MLAKPFVAEGMYDTENPMNPFRGPYNESQLDGPDHRSLAREATARSMVLLKVRVPW